MNENILKKIGSVPVLVAGDVMVDEYIIGDVERISPESPVPVVVARDRLRRLGGAGNVVRNIVAMGGKVALIATVGRDEPGDWFKQHCEEMAVESFWLRDDRTRRTTIKTRIVARNQQMLRIDEENMAPVSPELEAMLIEDIRSVMPQVKVAILSDYGKGLLTDGLIKALIAAAKVHGVPILVDPKGMNFARYRGSTYLTPNVREAATASGVEIRDHDSLLRAGEILLNQTDAKGIVITRGRQGITLVTRRKSRDFPVKPVEIIDVTGAGDTVISALSMGIANGLSVDQSIVLANLAASIAVSRFGATSVTLEEMILSLKEEGRSVKSVAMDDIDTALRGHRIQGQKIVFTNGCFDLFHPGHLELLRCAATLGQVLVVGVNSDKSVSRIKGPSRPIISQPDRVDVISALGFVDYVVIFDDDTPLKLIEQVRPDILVKGEDWKGKKVVGEDIVRARGGRVEFVKLLKGVSTTQLIQRIRGESSEAETSNESPSSSGQGV